MKRKIYERPQTTLMCIEVENGFMNASVGEEDQNDVSAGNQEIEGDYDFTNQEDIWQ